MLKSLCFSKKILAEIEKCYACLGKTVNGEPCLFFAGEGDGSVHAFLGESFERHETIWQGGGGTMGIVAIPGHDEWTLVSRGFYSMVDCGESTIEIVRDAGGHFTHEPIAALPYLHRFGALKAQDGMLYLVAASLHSGKADKADWSKPGHLYWAQLPDNMEKPFHVDFQPFEGEYYQNHGFCTACVGGIGAAYTSSREGVFAIVPPANRGGAWTVTQLMDFPVSDIAVTDLDGDGKAEIAALSPFHGNRCRVYKDLGEGYEVIYTYPLPDDFFHTILSATLGGAPVFIGGARKLTSDLFLLRWDAQAQAVVSQQIDVGQGPSNAAVLNLPQRDILLAANRMVAQAAIFEFPR